MRKAEFFWTWTTDSPLHCGAGLSRAGVADHLIRRTADKTATAMIPGDAVKGALRMSAEQIAGWLGYEERHEPTEPVEPQSAVLALVFGGSADAYFEAARLAERNDRDVPSNSFVAASTRIDPNKGAAAGQSLRKTEALQPGSTFSSKCVVHADGLASVEQWDAAVTLLAASLASTEQIGAKAAIGWGRLSLTTVECRLDDAPVSIETILTPVRLDGLRLLLSTKRSESPSAPARTSRSTANRAWFRLDICMREAACFPGSPEVTHKIETRDFIPASAVRGAMIRRWRREGVATETILQWVDEGSRWTPGFPESADGVLLPAPRSVRQVKRGSEVHDVFAGPLPESDENGPLQWRRLGGGWIAKDGTVTAGGSIGKQVSMHVARDYVTGTKREGALFARESLVSRESDGLRFTSWAFIESTAWRAGESFDLHFGKRTSAGYGQATVTVRTVEHGPFAGRQSESAPDTIVIHLATAALVRDASGYPLRGLSFEWWERFLGPESGSIDRVRSAGQSASRPEGGWMRPWGHLRSSVTTIAAGSVWKLVMGEQAAVRARQRLSSECRIGERGHEGFGWLVVDPPWHGAVHAQEAHDEGAPGSEKKGNPWPGCERCDSRTLVRIASRVSGASPQSLQGTRGVLQTLAQQLRAGDLRQVREEWQSRAREAGDSGPWASLGEGTAARRYLDEVWHSMSDRETVRFAVEALLIRAGRGER